MPVEGYVKTYTGTYEFVIKKASAKCVKSNENQEDTFLGDWGIGISGNFIQYHQGYKITLKADLVFLQLHIKSIYERRNEYFGTEIVKSGKMDKVVSL